ncbi:MAG: PEGA domain-containing protein [Candidatus Magasanikbacteria bacterium]|nr:PEGA domain-containing protein [Candidatus Magasanikbacteria bacterium]
MEYPGSKFTRPWRVTMMYLFIAAFFIISPLLVLYTSGYRYDFKNGIIQEIGAISIDVLPKNSNVFLNEIKIPDKMPIRLKNVSPGKYKIKISADGFYDWEKEVTVENKQTIYIKEIKLIKKSTPEKIIDGQINQLSLSTDKNYLIYQKINDKNQEFYLRDLNNNKDSLIFADDKNKKYQMEWFENADLAAISALDNTQIMVVEASAPKASWDLTKEEKNKITKWQWSNAYDGEIYYSTKNELTIINALTKQKTVVGKNSFLDWLADNRQIWSIQHSTSTEQSIVIKNSFGSSQNFLILNDSNNDGTQSSWYFVKTNGNQILLKKSNQSEMLLVYQGAQYNFYGEKFLNSPYNNWWIMWTPWEITTYSQGEEPFLLNRSGEKLNKVVVLDEYNTLGLIWQDKMTVLFPYYFVNHTLINQPINDAVADSQNRVLYFSGKINDQAGLWKINY